MEDGLHQQYNGIYCEDHNGDEPVHSHLNGSHDKNNGSSNGGSGGAQSVVNRDGPIPYDQKVLHKWLLLEQLKLSFGKTFP